MQTRDTIITHHMCNVWLCHPSCCVVVEYGKGVVHLFGKCSYLLPAAPDEETSRVLNMKLYVHRNILCTDDCYGHLKVLRHLKVKTEIHKKMNSVVGIKKWNHWIISDLFGLYLCQNVKLIERSHLLYIVLLLIMEDTISALLWVKMCHEQKHLLRNRILFFFLLFRARWTKHP